VGVYHVALPVVGTHPRCVRRCVGVNAQIIKRTHQGASLHGSIQRCMGRGHCRALPVVLGELPPTVQARGAGVLWLTPGLCPGVYQPGNQSPGGAAV